MYLKSNKNKNVKSRYKNIINKENKDNINPHIQPIRNNKNEDDYKIILTIITGVQLNAKPRDNFLMFYFFNTVNKL
jgi:hypothetical protein